MPDLDDVRTVGGLDTGITLHSKDEFAELIAVSVREYLDLVGAEHHEGELGLRWRNYVVFVAVSYLGDLSDEPNHGHPTVRA